MSFGTPTADIVAAMKKLDTEVATKDLCSVSTLANKTGGGNDVHVLEIKPAGAAANRPIALIVGGIHSRELAPPAAVFSFGRELLKAYAAGGPVKYPSLTDGAIVYPAWEISAAEVKKMVDKLTIQLVPVANPDGRNHVLAGNADWRGNRNTAACAGFGVDINRNFDIGWDTAKYYSAADEAKILGTGTGTACSEIFRGPSAGSENETKNLKTLIDSGDVRYFIDVHSHGRRVLMSWGIAGNQDGDPTKNFANAALDRQPNGTGGREVLSGAYEEFMPDDRPHRVMKNHKAIAEAMKDAILDQAGKNATAIQRSTYQIKQVPQLYQEFLKLPHMMPVPGSSADYALSRQFRPGEPAPAYAFALEIGYKPIKGLAGQDPESEGGFVPSNLTKYTKIERETHAALAAFLLGAINRKKGP
jgi:Zinc carboxypeptidase